MWWEFISNTIWWARTLLYFIPSNEFFTAISRAVALKYDFLTLDLGMCSLLERDIHSLDYRIWSMVTVKIGFHFAIFNYMQQNQESVWFMLSFLYYYNVIPNILSQSTFNSFAVYKHEWCDFIKICGSLEPIRSGVLVAN